MNRVDMTRPAQIEFARRLHKVCRSARFGGSVGRLAFRLGVSRYTAQGWLDCRAVPSGAALWRLAELGVDVTWLLRGHPKPDALELEASNLAEDLLRAREALAAADDFLSGVPCVPALPRLSRDIKRLRARHSTAIAAAKTAMFQKGGA
jgi:transcriptional regulator with XRE-family HTH domain